MAYITDSWEVINQNCTDGKADSLYAIGDLKTITLTWASGSTENIDLEIVDMDVDNLSDGSGKACLTFISKKVLWPPRKMTNTSMMNAGGWAGQYSLRSWCNGELYNALPSDLRSVIRSVKKLSDGGYGSTELVVTDDYVWLPSIAEIGNENHVVSVLSGQGAKYILSYGNDFKIKENSSNVPCGWWLRSTPTTGNNWYIINGAGSYYSYDGINTDVCVAFGLCVGANSNNAEINCDKYYYNGFMLPAIPADVPAQNQYAFIRHNTFTHDNGNVETQGYSLFIGTDKFYIDSEGKINSVAEFLWYTVMIEDLPTATQWRDDGSLNRGIGKSGGVIWSNHDIPNGSPTATEIYCYSGKAVPKYSSLGNPDDYYKIKGSTLVNMSKQINRISGTAGKLTPEEMLCLLATI
jgi:hypothetical protein